MKLGKVLGMAGLAILPFTGMSQEENFSVDEKNEKYIELSDSIRKYAGEGYSDYIIEKCLP